jgi:hypothetical protein
MAQEITQISYQPSAFSSRQEKAKKNLSGVLMARLWVAQLMPLLTAFC